MINDSERREVAARLREQRVWDIFTNFENCIGDICDAVFDDEGDLNDMFRLQKALADLIDRPTCENINEHYDVFECSECHCKVEVMGECRSEYGGIFHAPFLPSYCPSCGAEAV